MNYIIKYKDRFVKIEKDKVLKVKSETNASIFTKEEADTYFNLISSLYPYRFDPKFLRIQSLKEE